MDFKCDSNKISSINQNEKNKVINTEEYQQEKNIKGNIFQQNEVYEDKDIDYEGAYAKRPLDDPEEYDHLKTICSAFFNYQIDSLRDVARMERDFSSIPTEHLALMKNNYKDRIEKMKKAIWKNYLFLLKIVSPYSYMFKFFKSDSGEFLIQPLRVIQKDIVKMRSTLKLFIRDWSKEVKGLF